MKHVLAWLFVLIVIAVALLYKQNAGAAELIIVHPGTQETMQGEIIELHDGFLDFGVHTYDSYAFDTIKRDGFDGPEGETGQHAWNVVLEASPTDVAFFKYICSAYVNQGAQQVVLYCVD